MSEKLFSVAGTVVPGEAVRIDALTYEDLLYYDGPILWTGLNSMGQRVLASAVGSDDGVVRDMSVILSEADWQAYTEGRVTYRTLLENANGIYILDWQDGRTACYLLMSLDLVPEEYRPTHESFYPGRKP